jgi:hypothetical protein
MTMGATDCSVATPATSGEMSNATELGNTGQQLAPSLGSSESALRTRRLPPGDSARRAEDFPIIGYASAAARSSTFSGSKLGGRDG